MKAPPWRRYLTARFGELPDELPLAAEDADEDLRPEESERRIKVMEAMAEAAGPFSQGIPDLTMREFALLGMAGVTAQQFAIMCEARRARTRPPRSGRRFQRYSKNTRFQKVWRPRRSKARRTSPARCCLAATVF